MVVHIGEHAAVPEVPAGGDDLFEELGHFGDSDVRDRFLELRGRHRRHPRYSAEPLWHVSGGVAEQGELQVVHGLSC